MTPAVFSADIPRVRACLSLMRALRDRLRADVPAGVAPEDLSEGMSGDCERSIEEGATVVRVGQAITRPRSLARA